MTDTTTPQPRRVNGRLRKLTRAEREKRQERRERLNPNREARKRAMRGRLIFEPHRGRPVGLKRGWFGQAKRAHREASS